MAETKTEDSAENAVTEKHIENAEVIAENTTTESSIEADNVQVSNENASTEIDKDGTNIEDPVQTAVTESTIKNVVSTSEDPSIEPLTESNNIQKSDEDTLTDTTKTGTNIENPVGDTVTESTAENVEAVTENSTTGEIPSTETSAETDNRENKAETRTTKNEIDTPKTESHMENATRALATNEKRKSSAAKSTTSASRTPRTSIAAIRENRKSVSADADMLESVLQHVGDMGRYQKLLFLAMLPFGFFFAFVYFVQMFIDVAPENYWCKIPELQHLDLEDRRMLSAPGAAVGDSWDSCRTFDVNWNDVLATMQPPPEGTPLIPCQHGWDFEFSDIPYETVASQRGWVCEYASYVPTAQTLFFVGSFCGSLFFGWIGDVFGRIPAIMGSNLIGAVGGIATIYTTQVWDFYLCRFITGMALDTAFMTLYILVLEYVGFRHRTWVANMSIAIYFGGGCMVLPWIALWMNDWRKLLWITSLPMFIVLLIPFIIPESARWLVSRGRITEAVTILRRFERINGTKIPEDVMDDFIAAATEHKEKKESLLIVFKNPLIRFSLIFLVLVYMGCSLLFDGLVRMSNTFGMDYFITFTLSAATEIPSLTILTLLLDRWGRRNFTTGTLSLSAGLIIVAIFVSPGLPQAALAIAARFFINMSYNTAIQWVTELLPTPVRASGSALMHTSGYVVIFISPFVVYSQVIWAVLPLLILGVVAALGSFMSLLLPETKGLPMPQTIEDSEWIVREKSLCRKPHGKQDAERVNNEEKPAT